MTKEELKLSIENKKKAISECIEICKKYGISFKENYKYTDDFSGVEYTLDFVIETDSDSLSLIDLENKEKFNSIVTDASILNGIRFNGDNVLSGVVSFEFTNGRIVKVLSNAIHGDGTELGVKERMFYVGYLVEKLEDR